MKVIQTFFTYNNFTCFHCNCNGRRGGGVMLQFSPRFQVEQISVVDYPKTCELLSIRQKSDNRLWLLVFRPLDCSVEDTEQLCNAIIVVKVGKCAVTVLGDFNAPTIDWSDESTAPKLHTDKIISDMCTFCDFTQLVRQPTRGIHCLDLVLTTKPDAFISVVTQPPIGNSDHDIVKCIVKEQCLTLRDRTTYNFSGADYNRLGGALSCMNWSAFFIECKEVDQYWEKFHALMTDLIDKFVPKHHCVRNRLITSR